MKDWLSRNHYLRPLLVVVVLVVILVVARGIYVPDDFGVHGGFTYNYYRQSNVEEWRDVAVKYQGKAYCGTCHPDKVQMIAATPHSVIQCENCHGPGVGHPETIPKLPRGEGETFCLRCHASLPYAVSGRADIVGIDPSAHSPIGMICVDCHNPHQPVPLPSDETDSDS